LISKLNEAFNYHVFLNKIEQPNVFLFGCLPEEKKYNYGLRTIR
jgi:hypothetical protein